MLITKGLQSEFYLNSGIPRTLLSKCAVPRIAALTSGAIGCLLGSLFKYFNKFGEKDLRHPITIGVTLMDFCNLFNSKHKS